VTDFDLRERVRSSTYYHVARLFEPPGAFLEDEGVLEALRVALEAVNPVAGEHAATLRVALAGEGLERVRRDHMRLFVGPGQLLAPPYGSVYLDGKRELLGPSTQAVERLYAEAGLRPAPDLKDAPDHVRVELDVMHLVVERTLDAMRAADWERAEALVRVQATLLQHHLSRWVTPFATLIRTGAETAFYRHVADLVEAVVKQEYLEDAAAMIDEFNALKSEATAIAGAAAGATASV
jgi:putative dimethyl sulfoxide reductase chaperone